MSGSERPTILVIEDDISMGQALHRILRLGGFEPRMYRSAETFLDDGADPAAICMVLDVQLPGMNGFALLERLSSRRLPPVILITAFDEPDTRIRAERASVAAFLAKPFAGRMLLDTIGRVVRATGAQLVG